MCNEVLTSMYARSKNPPEKPQPTGNSLGGGGAGAALWPCSQDPPRRPSPAQAVEEGRGSPWDGPEAARAHTAARPRAGLQGRRSCPRGARLQQGRPRAPSGRRGCRRRAPPRCSSFLPAPGLQWVAWHDSRAWGISLGWARTCFQNNTFQSMQRPSGIR